MQAVADILSAGCGLILAYRSFKVLQSFFDVELDAAVEAAGDQCELRPEASIPEEELVHVALGKTKSLAELRDSRRRTSVLESGRKYLSSAARTSAQHSASVTTAQLLKCWAVFALFTGLRNLGCPYAGELRVATVLLALCGSYSPIEWLYSRIAVPVLQTCGPAFFAVGRATLSEVLRQLSPLLRKACSVTVFYAVRHCPSPLLIDFEKRLERMQKGLAAARESRIREGQVN